ncbi:MAG: acyl-CoA thioesterase [Mycobacteriaceae bacterium]
MGAPYEFSLQPRWGDMDSLNHVNNVRYLDYAQESRIAFLEGLTAEAGHKPLVVGRQEVDYLRPLVYRNRPVVVQVVVGAVGNRSFTLLQTVKEPEPDGPVYAKVLTVMVCFDPSEGRSRPMHADERAALTPLLADSVGL